MPIGGEVHFKWCGVNSYELREMSCDGLSLKGTSERNGQLIHSTSFNPHSNPVILSIFARFLNEEIEALKISGSCPKTCNPKR